MTPADIRARLRAGTVTPEICQAAADGWEAAEAAIPRVKPLVWDGRDEGYWVAGNNLGLHYALTEYKGALEPFKLEGRGGFFYKTSYHLDMQSAQTAAQADYEARIRAALTTGATE